MKEKGLAILNTTSVVLVLFTNYYSQLFGINGNTVGSLSNEYENLFTPASYAFAIWGIIFLSMIAFAIFQLKEAFFKSNPDSSIIQTGYWFVMANVLNASWVVVWLYEWTWLSVIVMIGLLFCLVKIILSRDSGRVSLKSTKWVFTEWPIAIYAGWISVATIANFSAFLAKEGWSGGLLSEEQWTLLMILIATLMNLTVIWKWNLRSFALVGVWALFAIYKRHSSSFETIASLALVGSMVLLVAVVLHRLVPSVRLAS